MKLIIITVTLIFLFICRSSVSSEGSYYETILPYITCFSSECCNVGWKKVDISKLRQTLRSKLYGQHIALKMIPDVLEAFIRNSYPRKPLVLSLHGSTGTGKNYITNFLADALFKKGMKSSFVHQYISSVHFPHEKDVDLYKSNIQHWIHGNVSKCGFSLFIFDEMDKLHSGVIDVMKPYFDYYPQINGVDFRHSIFIMLSNAAGTDIMKEVYSSWKGGVRREDIRYGDLSDIITKGAYNEDGGLHGSNIIKKALVDSYIPFLPLERSHVRQCIMDEAKGYVLFEHMEKFVEGIVSNMNFWPEESEMYSIIGCRGIIQAVQRASFPSHWHNEL